MLTFCFQRPLFLKLLSFAEPPCKPISQTTNKLTFNQFVRPKRLICFYRVFMKKISKQNFSITPTRFRSANSLNTFVPSENTTWWKEDLPLSTFNVFITAFHLEIKLRRKLLRYLMKKAFPACFCKMIRLTTCLTVLQFIYFLWKVWKANFPTHMEAKVCDILSSRKLIADVTSKAENIENI